MERTTVLRTTDAAAPISIQRSERHDRVDRKPRFVIAVLSASAGQTLR